MSVSPRMCTSQNCTSETDGLKTLDRRGLTKLSNNPICGASARPRTIPRRRFPHRRENCGFEAFHAAIVPVMRCPGAPWDLSVSLTASTRCWPTSRCCAPCSTDATARSLSRARAGSAAPAPCCAGCCQTPALPCRCVGHTTACHARSRWRVSCARWGAVGTLGNPSPARRGAGSAGRLPWCTRCQNFPVSGLRDMAMAQSTATTRPCCM
jgi:hypothetical protein